MHTYIHTYIHTCMHAYIHTCLHACMHTYIHAYMHACMHTYIHAGVRCLEELVKLTENDLIPMGLTLGESRSVCIYIYTYIDILSV